MKKQKNRSVQNIYSTLKDRIVLMDYKPGELIREKVLMEEFDVSRTPIREALIRLETNELVKIVPNTGTFVTEVSFSKLQDLIELRTCLISFSGKLAARRITEEELEEMSKLIKEISESNDPKKIMQIDLKIHSIVNIATRNDSLNKMLNFLEDQTSRIWSFSPDKNSYYKTLEFELGELYQALKARDEERSAKILEEHLANFVDFVSKSR